VQEIRIAKRITRLPKHFFSDLVGRVDRLLAEGKDLIDLGRGNPDIPTPPHIVEELCQAVQDPRTHRYGPFPGLPELREAIAHWYAQRYGVKLDPGREVAVLFGSKVGLYEVSYCLLESGDLCLVPDPGYPDYWSGIAMVGAKQVGMPLLAENNFFPRYEDLPRDVARAAKLMFLNYPGNPTTTLATREFFEETVRFARDNEIIVAHDAAYQALIFDGRQNPSFLEVEGAKEVGVEFCSLSKTFSMAGWRVGFVLGNAEIIRAITILQNHLFAGLFPAVQRAAVAALTGPQDCIAEMVRVYQSRRDTFIEGLREIGWNVPKPGGSFFCWLPIPAGYSSLELANLFLEKAGVVVAPGVGFGPHGEGYVRAGLLTDEDTLREAARRIGELGIFGQERSTA